MLKNFVQRFIASPAQLRDAGVVGMNQRNIDFVMRYNPRRLYPSVDNKLKTKQIALANGIAVPPLYGVISREHEVKNIAAMLEFRQQFVIKPANGSGGNGILVVDSHRNARYQKASGETISLQTLQHHLSNILSGMYSLGGAPDQAIIEYRVQFDPFFDAWSYRGVPDLRVIVFRGVPVAAMLRLPTKDSDGRANLHQGAIGVGVSLMSGKTLSGVHYNRPCRQHPDTGEIVEGIALPQWEQCLSLATHCAQVVSLGYLGVDIVLDRDRGPLMLELNARPGLTIQLANTVGLAHTLRKVEALSDIPSAVDERVALAKLLAK